MKYLFVNKKHSNNSQFADLILYLAHGLGLVAPSFSLSGLSLFLFFCFWTLYAVSLLPFVDKFSYTLMFIFMVMVRPSWIDSKFTALDACPAVGEGGKKNTIKNKNINIDFFAK